MLHATTRSLRKVPNAQLRHGLEFMPLGYIFTGMAKQTKSVTVGRPTKYRPEMCDEIEKTLGEGFSFTAACALIGITKETGYQWLTQHPPFSDAVSRGKNKGQAAWEATLIKQARSGNGNTGAIIFAMKNMYRDEWSDKVETELSGPGGKPIQHSVQFSFVKADPKKEL